MQDIGDNVLVLSELHQAAWQTVYVEETRYTKASRPSVKGGSTRVLSLSVRPRGSQGFLQLFWPRDVLPCSCLCQRTYSQDANDSYGSDGNLRGKT